MSKRKMYGLMLVAILIAVGLLLARVGSVVAPAALTEQDEIQIYAAVIRALRGGAGPTYILRTTDDRGGDHEATQTNAVILSPSIQAGIGTALSDLSPGIVWLDQFSEVERDPMENGGRLKDRGSVITLGNLKMNGVTSVWLVAQVYKGSMDAAGYTYAVDKVNGVWRITGARQIWVS